MRFLTVSRSLFALAIILLAALAQAQETRGTISGAVLDATGAVLANAKVTATEVRTGVVNATISDASGQYNIPFLPPGEYEIKAEAKGFRSFVRKGIHLLSSEHPVIDIALQVGDTSETVTISAEAPLIETANASTGQSITTKQVEDFPLNGRNPIMVAQLALGRDCDGKSEYADHSLFQRRRVQLEYWRYAVSNRRNHARWRAQRDLGQPARLRPDAGFGSGSEGKVIRRRRRVRSHRRRHDQRGDEDRDELAPRHGILLHAAVGPGRQQLLQ
jgi:hypothetical protein